MTANPMYADDRRGKTRQRTLLRGRICYGDHSVISMDCVIRNISADGALLSVPGSAPLPSEFTLLHVVEGVSYDAHLAWRKGDLVGVALGDRHDLKGVVEAQLQALRGIWLELAPR